jgi:hypothetical protein
MSLPPRKRILKIVELDDDTIERISNAKIPIEHRYSEDELLEDGTLVPYARWRMAFLGFLIPICRSVGRAFRRAFSVKGLQP